MKVKYKEQEIDIPENSTIEVINGDLVITPKKQEFKDGDICYSNNGCVEIIFIYKKVLEGNKIYYYSSINSINYLDIGIDWIDSNGNLRLATKEEKQKLFDALDKSCKKWNPETKQIEDILKVGDICIFYDNKCKDRATIGVLSKIDNSDLSYMDNYCLWHRNAIKFESIEQYKNFIKQ